MEKNRYDLMVHEMLVDNNASLCILDGFSDIIDRSFEGESLDAGQFPGQEFPEEILEFLHALYETKTKGWLKCDSYIRDLDGKSRETLSDTLCKLKKSLKKYPLRYFGLAGGDYVLFIWMQQNDYPIDWDLINIKAAAATLSCKATDIISIVALVSSGQKYTKVQPFKVSIPGERTA